jgi:phosphatidylinositol alpha 1,6-mannosyltransferase
MDVFTHFGTEETFGQTIQEAQAAGLAVVAPNVGGPRNLIEDGVTGFLVDHNEHGAYEKAVKRLLDVGLRSKVGRNAEAAVSGKSWSANNAKLIGHYENALAATRARIAEQLELA